MQAFSWRQDAYGRKVFLEQRIDLLVGVHQASCRCRRAWFGLGLHLGDLILVSSEGA